MRRSSRCSKCEELRRLKSQSQAALRKARNLYGAAIHSDSSADLEDLHEELKQTLAAHKLICYAILTHRTQQHVRPADALLAA